MNVTDFTTRIFAAAGYRHLGDRVGYVSTKGGLIVDIIEVHEPEECVAFCRKHDDCLNFVYGFDETDSGAHKCKALKNRIHHDSDMIFTGSSATFYKPSKGFLPTLTGTVNLGRLIQADFKYLVQP